MPVIQPACALPRSLPVTHLYQPHLHLRGPTPSKTVPDAKEQMFKFVPMGDRQPQWKVQGRLSGLGQEWLQRHSSRGTWEAYQGLCRRGSLLWVRSNEKLCSLRPRQWPWSQHFGHAQRLPAAVSSVWSACVCVPSVFRDISFHQVKNLQQCHCTNIACLARMLCGFLMAVKTLFILKFTPYLRNLWF